MGRKASSIPIIKHKVGLFAGDLERLQELFPKQGASYALRIMLRNFLNRVEATPSSIEIDIDSNVELTDD